MWSCKLCGTKNEDEQAYCKFCNTSQNGFSVTEAVPQEIQPPVQTDDVILTTCPFIEGYSVSNIIDIVATEYVYEMNLFRDWFAGVTDVSEWQRKESQNVLRYARETVLNELRSEAKSIGANAVIDVNLTFNQIREKGKSMFQIVASGTAVVVEKHIMPGAR